MTDTEAKALALVNEDNECNYLDFYYVPSPYLRTTLKRAVEREARHAAEMRELKERFSETVERVLTVTDRRQETHAWRVLSPFILPAPDPLESWLHKSGYEGNLVVEQALADLTKSGGKIVWEAGDGNRHITPLNDRGHP